MLGILRQLLGMDDQGVGQVAARAGGVAGQQLKQKQKNNPLLDRIRTQPINFDIQDAQRRGAISIDGQSLAQPRSVYDTTNSIGRLNGNLGGNNSEGGDYPVQGNSMRLQGTPQRLQAPRTYWQNTDYIRRNMLNPQLQDNGYNYLDY